MIYFFGWILFFQSQGRLAWRFRRMGTMERQSVHDEIYVSYNLSSSGFCLCLTLAYGGMKGPLWLWFWPRTQWALKYNTYTLLLYLFQSEKEKRRLLGILLMALFFIYKITNWFLKYTCSYMNKE